MRFRADAVFFGSVNPSRTIAAAASYSARSPAVSATDSVRANRRVNCSPTVLRRLRTITSPSSACSSSTFFGVSLSPLRDEPPGEILLRAQQPGSSSVTRLNSSSRLFCTGVAVSSRMNCFCDFAGEFPGRGRRGCAGGGLHRRSPCPISCARIAERCGSRLAVWIETITRSCFGPGGGTGVAECRIVVAGQLDAEFAPHLSLPLRDQRRRRQHQHRPHQARASAVRRGSAPPRRSLPSPTSSHSIARPRSRRSTVIAVRVWCSSNFHLAHHRQRDQPIEARVRRQPTGQQSNLKLIQIRAVGWPVQQLSIF